MLYKRKYHFDFLQTFAVIFLALQKSKRDLKLTCESPWGADDSPECGILSTCWVHGISRAL